MKGRDGSLAVQGRFDLDLGRGEGLGDRTAVFRKRNLFAEDPGSQAGDLGCGLKLDLIDCKSAHKSVEMHSRCRTGRCGGWPILLRPKGGAIDIQPASAPPGSSAG